MARLIKKFRIFLTFLLLLAPVSVIADADLLAFLEKENAELLWNPVTESGIIVKADSVVVFKIGIPWIIFDYTTKFDTNRIRRESGAIIFPDDALKAIHDYFLEAEKTKIPPRVAVILIDPGHGGKDPGAYATHTINGKKTTLYEKDLTLKVSLLLYETLKKQYPDKSIILTRSTDKYLKLEERVEIANSIKTNEHEAIVYISIHFNASFNKKAKGFEVWYLPPEHRRTLIDMKEVPEEEKDIAPILNTMLEEEYTLESITLAESIYTELGKEAGDRTEARGLKEESWFVVRNAKMPSVLLELGFISNSDEAALLSGDSYLQKLSRGIYNGICLFITQFENTKGFTE